MSTEHQRTCSHSSQLSIINPIVCPPMTTNSAQATQEAKTNNKSRVGTPRTLQCPPTWMLVGHWLRHSAWPGMGLFGESYILFSIGTLTPLWKELYPDCFNYTTCSPQLLHSLTYSVVAGVIAGMVIIGYYANTIGRRKGSLLTASLMAGGAISMVVQSFLWASQESILFRSMVSSLFFFGVGVGGEYPLSCSLAAENAHMISKQKPKIHTDETCKTTKNDKDIPLMEPPRPLTQIVSRGRQIQLVFAMQGVGIWFNSVTLLLLLWITGQASSAQDYQPQILLTIWRITYSLGATTLLIVLVTRYFYLDESKVWEQNRTNNVPRDGVVREQPHNDCPSTTTSLQIPKKQYSELSPDILPQCSTVSELSNPTVILAEQEDNGGDVFTDDISSHSTTTIFYNYGGRLFGASMAWLLWDISFYGNKLFQATFLLALTGEDTTLVEFAMAATLNSSVALLGYFGAAFLLDNPRFGRVKQQCIGFIVTGALFLICGFAFDSLSAPWLVGFYLACSFVGQLGPNATTFLIPGEIFPTEQRTYCHGICAAAGKIGALIAAIMFHFISRDADLFLSCGYASFIACVVTYYFIPESSGLDLSELDKKWHLIKEGNRNQYCGPANQSKYLSPHECRKSHPVDLYNN